MQVAVPVRLAARVDQGLDDKFESNFAKAHALLKEAGYDGTPVVLMQSTDIASLTNLAPVAKSLMEKAGFKVDMQAMDWQTLVVAPRQEGPAQRRRLARVPDLVGLGRHPRPGLDRASSTRAATRRRSAGRATPRWRSCATPSPSETDPGKQKAIAEAVQLRAVEYPTHVQLGQYVQPQRASARTWSGCSRRRRSCSGTSR